MGINGSKDEHSHQNDMPIPSRSNRHAPVSESMTVSTRQPVIDSTPGVSASQAGAASSSSNGESAELVPTVFKWEHGGKVVYITGTFNNWERRIPMHRSGNDFTYVHNLKKGKHAFKFIVDEEWRYAPDQPTIADVDGQINNFIDVSEFIPYEGDSAFFVRSKERKVPDEDFRQVIPDLDDYTKE